MREATTHFQKAQDIAKGGVLFALPALISNGLLKNAHTYYSLPPGYYNLKHIFITLAFIVLLRIKSIESIQYCSPGELGKVLGLDRIPEIKTIRKKLSTLAKQNNAEKWNQELSTNWMETSGSIAGLLYVDGHVRVYHGKKTKLPKRYVSREKLCLRGMTDYWVNDALGQPYFVISTPHNSGLIAILNKKIIPRLLKEVPCQPSEKEFATNPLLSRFSIIFDREGYSPVLFKQIWKKHRISCYTYKKYPGKDWSEEIFIEQTVKLLNGEKVLMKLAERKITLGKKGTFKEIRKLTKSGHQTSIVTTDFASETSRVAATMFARWSQENFFKYMQQHFGIDKLIEYGITPVDETTKVINPVRRTLETQIRSIRQKLARKIAEFGHITFAWEGSTIEKEDKQLKDYVLQKSQLQEVIESYQNTLNQLKTKRQEIDTHITIAELPEPEKYGSLSTEKKHILDTIKMIAYRAETAMATLIQPQFSKRKETRSLLRQIFATEVDIVPDEKNNILYVTLHSLSNERSNKIAADLCTHLNETETIFPGTNMRVFYKSVAS